MTLSANFLADEMPNFATKLSWWIMHLKDLILGFSFLISAIKPDFERVIAAAPSLVMAVTSLNDISWSSREAFRQ